MKTIAAETESAQVEGSTSKSSARCALAGLSLAMLLSSLGTSIANVSLPTLAHAFAATFQEVQWVVLAYLVAATALIVAAGRLGDMGGRRRLLLAGIFVFTAASMGCAFAPTLWLLIAARAMQGVGAAAMMALTMAFVGDVVPKAGTGRAMGLLGTMSAVGTALGPSLGGLLIAASGWRTIFLLNVPLGLTAFFLAHQHLPADRVAGRTTSPPFAGIGALVLALALAAYAFAMTIGRGRFGWGNLGLLALAAGLTGLFVFAESKATAPLLRLTAFRVPRLRANLLTSALVSSVMMTTLVVGPFYLSLALGLKSAIVGLVLSIGPLIAAFTGVPAGRMVDRLGAPHVVILGLVGIGVAALALAFLPAPLGVAAYVAPIAVMTASYALFQTANNTAVMQAVPSDERGVVSGMLNLSRNLGLVTGASLMGAVFAFASGATDITTAHPAAIAGGMKLTFAVAAIVVGGALALVQGNRAAENGLTRSQLAR